MTEDVLRATPADEQLDTDLFDGWLSMALGLRAMINRLHLVVRADYGLTAAQFEALGLLHSWGEVTMRELGDGMLYSSGSTSNLVSQLERRGLARRSADAVDRRVVRIELTEAGSEVITLALADHRLRVVAEFADLLAEGRDQVLRFGRRVAAAERIADRRPERIRALVAEYGDGASHRTPRSTR